MALEKVVMLRGWDLVAPLMRDTHKASEAGIKPGMGLEPDGVDDAGTPLVAKRSAAAGSKIGMYAIERDEAGNDLEVAYAVGDNVKWIPHVAGVTLNLLLAASQDVEDGDRVVHNGDGTFKAATGTSEDATVGYVDGESVSTAADETARCAVRLA